MEENSTDLIRTLECRAFNSWPALQTLVHDGWLLRFARGHTKRANSVNALWPGKLPLAARIAHAEALYRRHGLAPTFRLTPLSEPDLDAALAARGYARVDPTHVMRRPIGSAAGKGHDVQLAASPLPGWLGAFGKAAGASDANLAILGQMLGQIVPPAAYARIDGPGGAPHAFGMGVVDAGALGIFEMLTVPEARRRGHAARVIDALSDWGRTQGAGFVYLQVVADNAPARALYERLGFEPVYAYHYRRAE
ncbi:MAG: GNAT family N-acetyltransferase [Proteobacteria bacterium]|nr:GNAT family N-acetyltransferase [Pseudomonadota bacterium]